MAEQAVVRAAARLDVDNLSATLDTCPCLCTCRGKGRFVVVSSMAAKVPSPGQAVYSAAKMGVWGYFASLSTELADK
jgi:short-subunit dehydrogenase